MSTPLEDALRDCVREICEVIASDPRGPVVETSGEWRWERNSDGNFSRQPRRRFRLNEPRELDELESFRRCADLAKDDPIVGPQIGQMAGTNPGMKMRLDMREIVRSLVYGMLSVDGRFQFGPNQFQERWELLIRELGATVVRHVTIAPLPNFKASLPVSLSENISIDRLTDIEVSDCARTGILRPQFEAYPVIESDQAIGIRSIVSIPRVVGEFNPTVAAGTFGYRTSLDLESIPGDAIIALRLFKKGTIRCCGSIATQDGLLSGKVIHSRPGSGRPSDRCQYELNESEVAGLQVLWRTLSSGVLEKKAFVSASLRRFDMASDRERMEDRIVDLMIAAESLFLHDAGPARERGEMRYRLAVRAAGYVQSANYNRRQVYDLLREAYDVRSTVVHGGTIKHSKLPDKTDASLGEFVLAVEEVMRAGIKKALVDPDVEKPGFWDGLLFPGGGAAA
jgi:Apea-like HEPN